MSRDKSVTANFDHICNIDATFPACSQAEEEEAGRMKPQHERLVDLAFHCETSAEHLLGQSVVESELLKAAEVSFRDAVAGLPPQDIESIHNFIKFVRAEHRRRVRAER